VHDDLIIATGRSDYPNQVNNVQGKKNKMIKLGPVTIILFFSAVAAYFVSPLLRVGLFVIGLLLELAGWISIFRDPQRGKNKDSES